MVNSLLAWCYAIFVGVENIHLTSIGWDRVKALHFVDVLRVQVNTWFTVLRAIF